MSGTSRHIWEDKKKRGGISHNGERKGVTSHPDILSIPALTYIP